MTVFYVNIGLIFFWKLVTDHLTISNKKKAYCVILAIQFILLFAFRDWSMGGKNMLSDLFLYQRHFEAVKGISLWDATKYNSGKSMLFYFIMALFSKAGMSFEAFVVLFSAFFFIVVFQHFYRYSEDVLVSVCVFLGTGTFTASFFMLRQVMAICVLVFAYECFMKKQTFRMILLVVIAVLVHSSAIVIVPFFVLGRIKMTKTICWMYFLLLVITMVFRVYIASFITLVFDEGYLGYYDSRVHIGGNALLCIGYTILFVLLYYHDMSAESKRTEIDNYQMQEGESKTYLMHGFILIVIIQLCASFSYAFTRLNYFYFLTVFAIGVPVCLDKVAFSRRFPRVWPLYNLIARIATYILMISLHFISLNAESIEGIKSLIF